MVCGLNWFYKFFTDPIDEYIEKYIVEAPKTVRKINKKFSDSCCCKSLKVFSVTLCVVLVSFGIFKVLEYYLL